MEENDFTTWRDPTDQGLYCSRPDNAPERNWHSEAHPCWPSPPVTLVQYLPHQTEQRHPPQGAPEDGWAILILCKRCPNASKRRLSDALSHTLTHRHEHTITIVHAHAKKGGQAGGREGVKERRHKHRRQRKSPSNIRMVLHSDHLAALGGSPLSRV